MIVSKIPGIAEDFEAMRALAPSGFVLAINVRWTGPEFLHSEFPARWRKIYEDNGYFMFDPLYYWIAMFSGKTRWSEVNLPDPQGIMKKAATHGLVYGATVAVKSSGGKSFLSGSRADREFTDEEIEQIDRYLTKWLAVVTERPILTEGEFDTLKLMRDGMEQADIAGALDVSVSTIKKRVKSIRRKFNAKTAAEALSIAVEKRYFPTL